MKKAFYHILGFEPYNEQICKSRIKGKYVSWSFNSGTDFFVSEYIDLMASWSCLLQNSVLVLVCTYFSAPAIDESTSGSHFLY